MADPFIGQINIFPYNFAPRNWAFCSGQLLQISQNTALFALLGTTYGGDGRTTFGLPNLMDGNVAMHTGNGPGLSPRRMGQRGGEPTVQLADATMASHTHTMQVSGADGDTNSPANNYVGRGTFIFNAPPPQPMIAGSISLTGGGGVHNNLQPYQVLAYCIALVGVFPSRS